MHEGKYTVRPMDPSCFFLRGQKQREMRQVELRRDMEKAIVARPRDSKGRRLTPKGVVKLE